MIYIYTQFICICHTPVSLHISCLCLVTATGEKKRRQETVFLSKQPLELSSFEENVGWFWSWLMTIDYNEYIVFSLYIYVIYIKPNFDKQIISFLDFIGLCNLLGIFREEYKAWCMILNYIWWTKQKDWVCSLTLVKTVYYHLSSFPDLAKPTTYCDYYLPSHWLKFSSHEGMGVPVSTDVVWDAHPNCFLWEFTKIKPKRLLVLNWIFG
jgi:hypothetical protein